MTVREPRNVLFVRTGNPARSILNKAILSRIGNGQFKAFSVGSRPRSKVHPNSIELLENLGRPITGISETRLKIARLIKNDAKQLHKPIKA